MRTVSGPSHGSTGVGSTGGANGTGEHGLGLRSYRRCSRQLAHHLSDQTVGNILRRHGIAPAPQRSRITSWKDFISAHKDVLASADFFTVEVLTLRGLVTYYVLFFIHLESRRISVAGITRHPNQEWMEKIARSATQET